MTYNDFLCCVMQTKSNTCFSITKATMTQPLSIESSIVVHNTRKENGMLIGLIGNYMIGNMLSAVPSFLSHARKSKTAERKITCK
jgi:hypothetical protein